MNPFKALFGKGETVPRPALVELVPGGAGADLLLVDGAVPPAGDEVAAELPGCVRLRHGPDETTTGVPFREDDGRRLPTGEGGFRAIVLLDVLDRVLEPSFALRAAAASLAPGGAIVVVQQVAPDDVDARGAWNALARLRDPRQTWTPTRRQLRALCGDAGFERGAEALWEEPADVRTTLRPETERLHGLYVSALETSGLVREGTIALRRLALVLRPR